MFWRRRVEKSPWSRVGEVLYSWVESLLDAVMRFVHNYRIRFNTTLRESMKTVVCGKENAVKTRILRHSDETLNLIHFGGREM